MQHIHFRLNVYLNTCYLKSCWQIASVYYNQPPMFHFSWHFMCLSGLKLLYSNIICDNCSRLQSATVLMGKSLMPFELFAGCGWFCMHISFLSHVTENWEAHKCFLSWMSVMHVVCAALKCFSSENFNESLKGSVGYRGSSCSAQVSTHRKSQHCYFDNMWHT